MSENPDPTREETPETVALDDAIAPDTNGQEDWRAAYFSMLKHARSLERRLVEARRENIEHAITQVKATRIIRELDAKLDTALRETEAIRQLLAIHNMGGETDYTTGPIKRAIAAEAERDAALRELAAERESVASWKRIAMAAGAALAEKGKP